MSYIGNTPTSIAFLTDLFTGTGSLSVFTMSTAPATTSSILVSITGVLQEPSTYAVSGTTLTFSQAPPAGTGNISVRYLGIPASGVTSTAYKTVTEFTATLAQTIFTVPSYTVGYITVYRNGARLGAADYTATTGTNVVLTVAANTGDLIATESFYVSSVLNAIPAVAGAVTSSYIVPNVTLSSPSYTGTLTGSTGILNIGSGQVYKDASGNVGIGTSSPGTTLQLGAANAVLRIGITASNQYGELSRDNVTGNIILNAAQTGFGNLVFQTTSTERMRIDSSGNVGIGTSSPGAILHTSKTSVAAATVGAFIQNSDNTVGTEVRLGFAANTNLPSQERYGWIGYVNTGGTNGGALTFATTIGGTPATERMRIDSSGNVGIGTSSPSKILHVSTSNGNGIYLEDGSSANASPIIRVRGWRSDANGSPAFGGGLVLERKGDSATANGNVLGTIYFGGNYNTTPNFGYAASISGIADGAFTSSTNTPTALTFYTGVTPNLDTNNANVFTGTERMRIDSSGALILVGSAAQKATGTTWSNPSDIRLKDNITSYAKGLNELMQVSVKEWEYNGKGGTPEGLKGLGVIADEVMLILPNTVENYKAKLNTDDEEDSDIKKFDATEITWLMLKSIQELKVIIDTQQEQIDKLGVK